MSRPPYFIASSLLLLLGACSGTSETSDSAAEGASEGTSATGGIVVPGDTTTGADPGTTTALPTTSESESTTVEPTTDDLNCGIADIKADVRIPRVMLVLDKSGSMVAQPSGYWDADNDDPDGDGFVDGDPNMTPATPKVTRWSSLYAVVDFIVTGFEERMDFGAVLFPSTAATKGYDAGACAMNSEPEVAVGTDQGAAILAAIPAAGQTTLLGGTPAATGVFNAIAGLARDEALPEEEDLRYIVVVTDGAANCNDEAVTNTDLFEHYDDKFPMNVAAAMAAGIPTFVVGIDIKDITSSDQTDGNPNSTNTYERLNEVAELGGQAREGAEKFYNTQNQVELQAALEAISQEITSCTFPLSAPLEKYQYVRELTVQTPSDPLGYGMDEVADCAAESGWHFTDDTRSAIELCGDACSAYKATGKVDIVFDCYNG